jgi:acetyl-CoA carboxylase alpha subunit
MQPNDSAFEEPLAELRRRIAELEGFPDTSGNEREIERLRAALKKETAEVYGSLSRWQ